MPRSIWNIDVWLQRFLLPHDVKIERIINNIPSLTENQIAEIKSALRSYSANMGYRSVEGYILDDLLIGYPINLVEMKGIYAAVRHVSGGPTTWWFAWHRTQPISAEEQAAYECLRENLKGALDEMMAEKLVLASHASIIAEQNVAQSAARAAKWSALATGLAALAAIAQVVIALCKK